MRMAGPDVRRVLVLRGGALGDFIVTLPTLVALRKHWPDARIALAGNRAAAELALRRGLLDAVHSQHEARWGALFGSEPLPGDFSAWLSDFDLVINFWPDPDGDLRRRFPLREGQQWISAAAVPSRAPAAAHYAGALRPLGIEPETLCPLLDAGPDPALTPEARTVAIHPGSGSAAKNWPAERWLDLMARLASPVLLVLGAAEERVWGRLADTGFPNLPLAHRAPDAPLRVARNLSLEELARELRGCRLFLGHDSGVSHLAAASGVPSILLFGPTDPAVWAPPAPWVTVVRGDPDLSAITPDDLLEAIRRAESGAIRPPAGSDR